MSDKEYKPSKRGERHTCLTKSWGKPGMHFCSCGPEGIEKCKEEYDKIKSNYRNKEP